jgi:hypothetical protein
VRGKRPLTREKSKVVTRIGLAYQGIDQDTTVWPVSMSFDDGKIWRIGQFAIEGRQAGDFIQEIVLINESWLCQLDEHARRGLFVVRDIELMARMSKGA